MNEEMLCQEFVNHAHGEMIEAYRILSNNPDQSDIEDAIDYIEEALLTLEKHPMFLIPRKN